MSHCTRPVFCDNKPRWYALHRKSIYKMIRQQARVAILGDSIVEGLARYPAVWNDHLNPFNTVNCGIGGDSIQHLLWRVGHLSIPQSLCVAVMLCCTNNMQCDKSQDIAEGVIACGLKLQEKALKLHVIVTGILSHNLHHTPRREQVQQTNSILKKICWTNSFSFIEPSPEWVSATGELNKGLYYTDHLHLVKPGNKILAKQMASIISVALAHNDESPIIHPVSNHAMVKALPPRCIMPCTYHHKPPPSEPLVSPILFQ